MLISCAIASADLGDSLSDLIVLPEGAEITDVHETAAQYPEAIVVAAVTECSHSRAVVYHRGSNRIDYLKVRSDGRTVGSGNYAQNPVYDQSDCCIGVLICMDVDSPEFAGPVIARVQRSRAVRKIICIPADMDANWFVGDALPFPQMFAGTHVVLSNHNKTHGEYRCTSFITDMEGKKVCFQIKVEAIYHRLP